MNLKCPACGAPFSADDVHVDLGVANCRTCRGVLDLRAADRPIAMPVPPRFTVDESDGFAASWRWFRPHHVVMLLFSFAWWAFLVVWYRAALGTHDTFGMIFPIGHVAVGVFVVYSALAGLLNRTRIGVDCSGTLAVAHGPLPWPTPKPLGRDRIEQLYVQRVESRGRNGTTISYTLTAIDVDGNRRKLVKDLEQDDARFLERRLERQLGIKDRAVEGEAAR